MLVEIDDELLSKLRRQTGIHDDKKLVDRVLAHSSFRLSYQPERPERGMKRRPIDKKSYPILFLDIDDVLVIDDTCDGFAVFDAFKSGSPPVDLWNSIFDSGAKAKLASLHEDFNFTYVISSSWSNHFTREQMCEIFDSTGLGFVSKNLEPHWTTYKARKPHRIEEIRSWLALHRAGRPYLILDDEDSGGNLALSEEYISGHVHLCQLGRGLDAYSHMECERLIRAQY